MLNVRLIAGLLFLGALCAGVADLSHAATISYMKLLRSVHLLRSFRPL